MPSEFDNLTSGGEYGRSPFVAAMSGEQKLADLARNPRGRLAAAASQFGLEKLQPLMDMLGRAAVPGKIATGQYSVPLGTPGQVSESEQARIDAMNKEAVMAAPGIATDLTMARLSVPGRTPGTVETFAPGELLDRIFGTQKNKLAEEMIRAKASPYEIWYETGRFKPPGHPLLGEIPDTGARLLRTAPTSGSVPLSEVLNNPNVYDVFPGMKRVPTVINGYDPVATSVGGYRVPPTERIRIMADPNAQEMLNTVVHEGQHAVAMRTGMQPGSRSGPGYTELAGEILPRTVEQRIGMTPRALESTPPFISQKLPGDRYSMNMLGIPDWQMYVKEPRSQSFVGAQQFPLSTEMTSSGLSDLLSKFTPLSGKKLKPDVSRETIQELLKPVLGSIR